MICNLEKINQIKRKQIQEIVDVASKYPFVKEITIFGSSLREDCSEESDIDLCLDIEGTTRTLDFYNISVDINKICDYNCDILVRNKISGRIAEEINKKGVSVYVL